MDKPLWEISKELSIKAEASPDKREKARLAQQGMAYAEECIMRAPEDAACYYYRAMNTGIYYSAHVVGYQDGLKAMLKDCEKVISLDDRFDHGGAYRTMGKIYTEVPETLVGRNGIRRDLEKAIGYLKKAEQIDPNYPENQIYLAEAYLAAGRNSEALACLNNAVAVTPHWKNHPDYTMWQKKNKELTNKIIK